MLQSCLHAITTYKIHINFLDFYPLVEWMHKLFNQRIWMTVGIDTYYDRKNWQLFCSSVYQAVLIDGCVSLSQRLISARHNTFWDTIEVLWPHIKLYFPNNWPILFSVYFYPIISQKPSVLSRSNAFSISAFRFFVFKMEMAVSLSHYILLLMSINTRHPKIKWRGSWNDNGGGMYYLQG